MSEYITEAALAALCAGSYEAQTAALAEQIAAQVGAPVTVVATWPDEALAVTPAGAWYRIKHTCAEGGPVVEGCLPEAVPTVAADAVPRHVAGLARGLVADIAAGRCAGLDARARVRSLARLVEAGTAYWVADAVAALPAEDSPWARWYAADAAAIRQRVWGSVRAREERVPGPMPEGAPAPAVRAAVAPLCAALTEIIDEARALTFDQQDEALAAIRESLIGEAQAMVAALQGAGRLMQEDARDVARVVEALNRGARQARIMTIATGFLQTQARGPNDGGSTP